MPDLYYSLEEGAKAPRRASLEAAGYDLSAHHDAVILPGETCLVSTGIRLAMPKGLEAQVRPRSGLSLRTRLRISNSPGTIDSDYRGLVSVICENTASLSVQEFLLQNPEAAENFHDRYRPASFRKFMKDHRGLDLPESIPDSLIYLDREGYPAGTIFIRAGERIAQLIFSRPFYPDLEEAGDVSLIGHDRGGGFGSTGKI